MVVRRGWDARASREGGKKVPASIALDVDIHIERVKDAQLQLPPPVQWSGASTRRLENSISR